MPPNSVFDEPVTNLLSTLCILIEIRSGVRAKGSKRFKLFQIWHLYCLLSEWRHPPGNEGVNLTITQGLTFVIIMDSVQWIANFKFSLQPDGRDLLGGSGAVVNLLLPVSFFTSGAYFLHNGRRWQWICEFYTTNFKGIFGGSQSECVWQQAITCCSCYRIPQNAFFPRNSDLLVSQKTTQRHFFPTLHPLCPVIFATATVVAFALLRNSRFSFHCYTPREATPTQKSARKWRCDLSRLLARKITKGIHLCKPASLNHPILRLILFLMRVKNCKRINE